MALRGLARRRRQSWKDIQDDSSLSFPDIEVVGFFVCDSEERSEMTLVSVRRHGRQSNTVSVECEKRLARVWGKKEECEMKVGI